MTSTIPILYEDNHLLAIDKPEGLACIPERTPGASDLLTKLSESMNRKLFIVHRLDKEVSGVMLFAKTEEAHKFLNEQFAGRQVEKTYLALVHGVVKADVGQVEKPLRQFGSGRMGVDEQKGKPSQTTFRVKERFERFTLIMVQPQTGRRHQIRVHLYSLGHPIVGDPLYGDPDQQKRFLRLMLHSSEIEINLPSGEKKVFHSSLPPSFRSLLETIR